MNTWVDNSLPEIGSQEVTRSQTTIPESIPSIELARSSSSDYDAVDPNVLELLDTAIAHIEADDLSQGEHSYLPTRKVSNVKAKSPVVLQFKR